MSYTTATDNINRRDIEPEERDPEIAVPTHCVRCHGQGIELEQYTTTGWTFGYDANNREIEVEVEMTAVRNVACKARGCWQGRVFPLGWNEELDHAFNTGGVEAVREVLAAQEAVNAG